MTFPINTSPYGIGAAKIPASPGSQGGGFLQGASNFLFGRPGEHTQRSTLDPRQQQQFGYLQDAIQGRGASGAYGTVADYYRDQLSNQGGDFDAFAAPELRRFNEEIIPDLAHQFASFGGSGSLNGSSFRNAAIQAGSGLAERLAALRAQVRQQAAQGLQSVGQQGFTPTTENLYAPPTQGFLSQLAPAFGSALGLGGSQFIPSLFGPRGPRGGGTSSTNINQGPGGFYPNVTQTYDPYTDEFD